MAGSKAVMGKGNRTDTHAVATPSSHHERQNTLNWAHMFIHIFSTCVPTRKANAWQDVRENGNNMLRGIGFRQRWPNPVSPSQRLAVTVKMHQPWQEPAHIYACRVCVITRQTLGAMHHGRRRGCHGQTVPCHDTYAVADPSSRHEGQNEPNMAHMFAFKCSTCVRTIKANPWRDGRKLATVLCGLGIPSNSHCRGLGLTPWLNQEPLPAHGNLTLLRAN